LAGRGRGERPGAAEEIAADAELLAAEVSGHDRDGAGEAVLARRFGRRLAIAVRAALRRAEVLRVPLPLKTDRRIAFDRRRAHDRLDDAPVAFGVLYEAAPTDLVVLARRRTKDRTKDRYQNETERHTSKKANQRVGMAWHSRSSGPPILYV